jgi:hypothetical protein
MNKNYLEDLFGRMNDKLFFVLVIFIQIIFIFQGLDFADGGFHAEFYRRIFSDPSTVQYNFMYWFTGILGGIWLKLFPGLGLLGLRLAGVLVTTITLWVTYDLLKKYLEKGPLRLSLLLILLFLGTAIKEMNYDDVSALFFVCAAWFLFAGLTREKSGFLFLAGAFISLNTFSRIPNVAGLAMILVICFSGFLNHYDIKQIIRQSIIFLSGFLVMSVLLTMLMRALHHDTVFLESLKLAKQIGSSHDNTHNLYIMLKQYIVHFGDGLAVSVVVIVALWSLVAAWNRLKIEVPISLLFLRILKWLGLIAFTVLCFYRAKKDIYYWFYIYLFYAGMSLIVGFLIIIGRQPKNLRILAAIGYIIFLIMPIGSNYVLITVGKYSVWIILPIAIDYLMNIRSLSSVVLVSENSVHTYEQRINSKQIDNLRNICIYLTLIYMLSICYFYPYFDKQNRAGMHYSVHNERLRGIFTSESRARVVNELLTESALYIKPGDYVLAYDNIPMFYYITDTRPYLHNSWIWLYDDLIFKQELYKSLQETHICPVVILQKRSTLSNNWPENYNEQAAGDRLDALTYLQDFLKTYHYNQVWENDFFKIFVPAVKNPLQTGNIGR